MFRKYLRNFGEQNNYMDSISKGDHAHGRRIR